MSKKIDFEKTLNAEQRAPVLAEGGPMLVIAAAGTGKTRTLIYRVACLVERGIDPRSILLLTFTNKAANEMLDRARMLVGNMVSGLWGGTFHHVANRILRFHAGALGYTSDYTIMDRDDSQRLLRDCITVLDLRDKHFPKPRVLLGMFALTANRQCPLEELAEERFENHPVNPEDIVAVHNLYQKRKKEMNSMDFDDLLVNAWQILKQEKQILKNYSERFQHILVDEYQDTNLIQSELIDMLAGHHGNLMVVGDDFQSIYSWRGADFKNIMSFPDRYPNTRIFKLETNYRSVPEVLDVANACIQCNPEQFQKTLKSTREHSKKPTVVSLADGRQQALFVTSHIKSLMEKGEILSDIAIIYRSHYHALELQFELTRAQIPYIITSGMRFFEQAHIKDVCTILRLLNNHNDELSFIRLLCLLPRVGEKTARKIWRALHAHFNPLLSEHRETVKLKLPAPSREDWGKIEEVFSDLKPSTMTEDFGEIIYRFTSSFYDDYAVETFDNHKHRLEDIEELNSYTTKFDSLSEFLSEVALISNLDAENEPTEEQEQDTLRLTTIHQAKGLEWKVVFILWLADGMFPTKRAIDEPETEAEERRLFYVATTRAKDELVLCSPKVHRSRDGSSQFFSPSRFLEELPHSLLKPVNIAHSTYRPPTSPRYWRR